MSNIFVTGHRNPDTDSIVAAMAYANLKNALGFREYKAVRIGSINDETQNVLERFGVEAPMYVKDLRNQLADLEIDHPPTLDSTVTLDLAWRTMADGNYSTIPITNDDGSLFGMLSSGDIAAHDMETVYNAHLDALPVFNLISVLEGRLVNEYGSTASTISGDVFVSLPKAFDDSSMFSNHSIIICGNQPEVIDAALAAHVCCLILCQCAVASELSDVKGDTCIISTPMDARQVARLIFQATPVQRVCVTEDIVSFHLSDYVDDVEEVMLTSRFRSYPVLDENEKVVGTLSRYHLLRPQRKRVVLVDHNEASQSVPGLDQVEITEIIDHHRLADIQTLQPISMRNEPVGSTNTIITAMYQEHGVVPSPKMAGIMAAAILSDTVMFKSPTCTKRDIAMAERLAKIANVSMEELGQVLFSSSSNETKSADELFKTDLKHFHIAEKNIDVSQITCIDSVLLLNRRQEFLATMQNHKTERDSDMVLLMITDVLLEGTYLMYVGDSDIIQQAFSVQPKENGVFLPGVMSRKKQVIPMLTALWG